MSEKKFKKQKGGLVDPGINIFGNFPLLTTSEKPNIYFSKNFESDKIYNIKEPMKKFFTNKQPDGNNLKAYYRPSLYAKEVKTGGNKKFTKKPKN